MDFKEFIGFIYKIAPNISKNDVVFLFKRFDINGD